MSVTLYIKHFNSLRSFVKNKGETKVHKSFSNFQSAQLPWFQHIKDLTLHPCDPRMHTHREVGKIRKWIK